MEAAQLICEEWDSLSGQYTAEEADFMTQFLGGNYSCFPSNVSNTNFMCFSQGSSTSTDTYSCDLTTNIDSLSMFFCLDDAKFSPQMDDNNLSKEINYESLDQGSGLEPVKLVFADNNVKAEREYEMMVYEFSEKDRSKNMDNPAKRCRSSIEVSENTRNVRKCPKYGSSLSPKEPEAVNLHRKSRATATDAQSIYARRRRERINERLRILQTLVPNGTKVDISTMLEEAVQYVKFLQLQIKILSSDDKWMYAPIAYNGMDIGLDLSFCSPTKGR